MYPQASLSPISVGTLNPKTLGPGLMHTELKPRVDLPFVIKTLDRMRGLGFHGLRAWELKGVMGVGT